MKVLLTTTRIGLIDADKAAFAGLDVELAQVDGSDRRALLAASRDADALLVLLEDIDRDVIESMARCRSITRFGIGYDTIDVGAATENGIWVTNVPDANYREVAAHAMAMILALTRRLPQWDRAMKADGWAGMGIGAGIRRPDDQTVGLIGMGRIGGRVAEAAAAIGYAVQVYDPYLSAEHAAGVGVTLADFDKVLQTSDVVSVHVPLNDETRGIIDASAIESMSEGAILINVSRGGLVDEVALAAALRSGHLGGAGIDVWEHEPVAPGNPLLDCDTALLSPHVAHMSAESFAETRRKAFEEAARVLRGERPKYPVNQVRLPRTA